MASHARPWQNIYETRTFCRMSQTSMIDRKVKISRLQTIQFWRHVKWCHLPRFVRSLRWPSSFLQLDFVAWRNRFTSSWSDCVGFLTDSRIFKNRLGSLRHHVKGVTEAAWVHETLFVEVDSDARRGLVLSFSWPWINSAQFRRWGSTKGESSRKIMLTVVWNPCRFHLIDVIPKGSKFNAGHYISRILSPSRQILGPDQDDRRRHFVIHSDNTRPHYTKTVPLFWITIPDAEHLILLIRQNEPLWVLAFPWSEMSASRKFIRRTWWSLVR
jgi:hypothetical protein